MNLEQATTALTAVLKAARYSRSPNRRMQYIEEVAAAALEDRVCTADMSKPPRGDTVRHMVRVLLERCGPVARESVIGWLREGKVPPEPEIDRVEEMSNG